MFKKKKKKKERRRFTVALTKNHYLGHCLVIYAIDGGIERNVGRTVREAIENLKKAHPELDVQNIAIEGE